MKTAILSDIHSNLEALTRCREHAETQGVERYICLGDCVGYGADPAATMTLLLSLPGLIAVRGNHDEALFQDMGAAVPPGVQEAIQWTLAQLTPEQRMFLENLPYVHREDSTTYAHASASHPEQWEYLKMPEQITACLDAAGTPLTFIGHVHIPSVFYETMGGNIRELSPRQREPIPLSPRSRYVINVGSVGQPRDGNNASCYVIYDDVLAEVTFYRLPYNYLSTANKIRAAHLDSFFADRLSYGR